VPHTLGAWMAHTPDWHILDTSFVDGDSGLALPARINAINGASLEIQNLDRSDPPGYRPGGVPRSADFNRNLFHLGPAPCMPAIPVQCAVAGFDPATSPILLAAGLPPLALPLPQYGSLPLPKHL